MWYVLEGAGFELLLANARHVKNLPGRKTDACDFGLAGPAARVRAAAGKLRAVAGDRSTARPHPLSATVVAERAREAQRLQKLLEDAGIKLDSVATDIQGLSCRRMLEALIAGERDPEVLADMALTRMGPKIADLREALVGRFDDHRPAGSHAPGPNRPPARDRGPPRGGGGPAHGPFR